jgi:hypothetical protein
MSAKVMYHLPQIIFKNYDFQEISSIYDSIYRKNMTIIYVHLASREIFIKIL